jgi:hypothetical protein
MGEKARLEAQRNIQASVLQEVSPSTENRGPERGEERRPKRGQVWRNICENNGSARCHTTLRTQQNCRGEEQATPVNVISTRKPEYP